MNKCIDILGAEVLSTEERTHKHGMGKDKNITTGNGLKWKTTDVYL